MGGLDVMQTHLPQLRQDVLPQDLAILQYSVKSTRKLLPFQPRFNELLQGDLRALIGQAIFNHTVDCVANENPSTVSIAYCLS